jgi:O-acetylhomoserine/O-acetylserine sulfhydrylase-like pyridoxal-dependent enzyme
MTDERDRVVDARDTGQRRACLSVSIGIEHPSDLIADTAQALNEA